MKWCRASKTVELSRAAHGADKLSLPCPVRTGVYFGVSCLCHPVFPCQRQAKFTSCVQSVSGFVVFCVLVKSLVRVWIHLPSVFVT